MAEATRDVTIAPALNDGYGRVDTFDITPTGEHVRIGRVRALNGRWVAYDGDGARIGDYGDRDTAVAAVL